MRCFGPRLQLNGYASRHLESLRQLFGAESAFGPVIQPDRAEDDQKDRGEDRDIAKGDLCGDAERAVEFGARLQRLESGIASSDLDFFGVEGGPHPRKHELDREPSGSA